MAILQRSHELHGYPVRVDPAAAARTFYLRHGWREMGTARQRWGEHEVDAVLTVVDNSGGD